MRGGRGLPEPDKTFIFELLLVRVLCVISHCRIPLHPRGGKQNSNQATSRIIKKKKKSGGALTPPRASCLAYTFHRLEAARSHS